MELLFVTPYVPNLIRVRSYQLIRALRERGHRITLAALWSSQAEKEDLKQLASWGVQVVAEPLPLWRSLGNALRVLPTWTPLQAVFCWQPALQRSIDGLLRDRRFDVVHVEHLRGSLYGTRSARRLQGGEVHGGLQRPAFVYDSVDCISHLFAQAAVESQSVTGRLMTRLELERTRRYEGWIVHQYDRVLVTSPLDQRALAALAVEATTRNGGLNGHGRSRPAMVPDVVPDVVPNGVDLDYFQPGVGTRQPATLVFTGKLSYHANVTAALYLVQEVMPLVWAHRPDAKVWLVGKDPPPSIRRLQTSASASGGQVEVMGTVPDLRPYLHRATLAVAPLRYGAGIQNKVLEAMACATPVVASPQATSALRVQVDRDLLVGHHPQEFAAAILRLLADPALRAELAAAGRAYVERHHSWDAVASLLELIYQHAAGQNGHAAGGRSAGM